MRIVLDLHRTPDGSLAGTVEGDGALDAVSFHGVLELVNALEDRCDAPAAPPRPPVAPATEPPTHP